MWFASRRTLISRGLVTIAFGLLLVVWPTLSLEAFVLLFGAFALVDGAFIITTAIRTPRRHHGRAVILLAGVVTCAIGIFSLLWPGLTELAVAILIGLRALIIGAAEVAAAVWVCRHVSGASSGVWFVACVGLFSVVFGLVLLAYPRLGLVTLVSAIGIYAIALGLISIARAWLGALPRRRIPITVPR